jgi:hypothetical protein
MTNKGFSYVIYDMLGKMITKNTVTTSLQKVDVSHFASGHYNVIVSDESGARTTLRFMR